MAKPGRTLRLAPSLLSADFSDIARALREAEAGGADAFHLDIMDGHFVPNLTFGPAFVRAVRSRTRLPLDIHLMVDDPERFAEPFASAGGDTLVFHREAVDDPARVIERIQGLGVGVGVALRPGTAFEQLRPYLDRLDQVLVMSVEPGFSGQAFLPSVLPKLDEARRALDAIGSKADLSIDGGITVETAPAAAARGASFFVCGNAAFVGGAIGDNLRKLRRAVEEGAARAVP